MGLNDDREMAEKISCEYSFEKVIAIFLVMQIVFVQMEEKIVLFLTAQKIQCKIILALDINLQALIIGCTFALISTNQVVSVLDVVSNLPSLLYLIDIGQYVGKYFLRVLNIRFSS